ncbi:MAG: glycoside hydrolase family 127 protein [Victivallales bacterium]|nr:glycoside hydrolase family 127 protein [Victivallales bacterium]
MNECKNMRFLPKGVVRLQGPLGQAIDRVIEGRLKKIDYDLLVKSFKLRDEADGYWRCEFWGKVMRSLIYSWRMTQDEELLGLIRKTKDDILSTQTADGRITSYPEHLQLRGWDLWGRKYVLLGLLAYYHEVEPDADVLNAIARMTDDLLASPGRLQDYGEHFGIASSSILRALVEVAQATRQEKYLAAASKLAEAGCCYLHNIFDAARIDAQPAEIGDAKAYEMTSCFQGLCAMYEVTKDAKMLEAITNYYQAVREQEITITGTGGLKDANGEFWYHGALRQTRQDAGGMGETCVTVTWIWFCMNILGLTGDATVADEMERSLYNALLGAVTPDGSNFVHINPFLTGGGWKKPSFDQIGRKTGVPFDGHDCCRAQGPYGLAAAPLYAVMATDAGYAVNVYEDLTAHGILRIEGNYPSNANVKIILEKEGEYELCLRMPGDFKCKVDGLDAEGGKYHRILRKWKKGDAVELCFDFGVKRIVSQDGAYHCFRKGPLLLCQEQNGCGAEHLAQDGGLIDYATAGLRFSPENTLQLWFPN